MKNNEREEKKTLRLIAIQALKLIIMFYSLILLNSLFLWLKKSGKQGNYIQLICEECKEETEIKYKAKSVLQMNYVSTDSILRVVYTTQYMNVEKVFLLGTLIVNFTYISININVIRFIK